MRIFPIALILIGAVGVAKYFGWIPIGAYPLIGPVLLIALGAALLMRRRGHCRAAWRGSDGRSDKLAPPDTAAR